MFVLSALLAASFVAADCYIPTADSDTPSQVWINYGEEPSSMWVRYTTGTAPDAAKVRYGLSSDKLTMENVGNYSTYSFGLYNSPYISFVDMTGLTPATTYYYQVLGVNNTWSEIFSFSSHPGVGPDISLVVAVLGDVGQTTYSNNTIQHVIESNPDFVIINGDLSYADYDEPRWDSWGILMQRLSARVPIMVTPGNHEVEDLFGETFISYGARFRMPNYAQSKSQWWTLNVGPLALFGMNKYTTYTEGSEQYTYMMQAFENYDASKTPWGYLSVHPPGLCSNTVHQGEGYQLRDLYAPAMRNKVQVIGTGHVHAYERAVNDSFVFITIGDAGNREGLYSNWVDPQPSWSKFRKAEYGHGILRLYNSSVAQWEWHSLLEPEPTISDSAIIHRAADGTPSFAEN